MLSVSPELAQQKRFHIRQDDEFYRRLLSRESAAPVPSFQVHDGAACAVPFVWESRPGTPKHPCGQAPALPPLTPPPPYQFAPRRTGACCRKEPSSASLLGALFLPRLITRRRKPRSPPSLPPQLAPSASSFSPVGSCDCQGRCCRLTGPGSPFLDEDGEPDHAGLPTSTPCFGIRHGGFRGCCG